MFNVPEYDNWPESRLFGLNTLVAISSFLLLSILPHIYLDIVPRVIIGGTWSAPAPAHSGNLALVCPDATSEGPLRPTGT